MGKMSWISVRFRASLAELALVLLSILIMPYTPAAAGRGRCSAQLKERVLVNHHSHPAHAAGLAVYSIQGQSLSMVIHGEPLAVGVLFASACRLCCSCMLLAGGTRYVAPRGPAFAPREPRCDDRHLIIGLLLEARCPGAGEVRGIAVRWPRPTVWQENEFAHRLCRPAALNGWC